MVNSPLVSVIMPAFNSAEYIEEAIKSVQDQTYANWELIVIDDASVDKTVPVVEGYTRHNPRIKLLKNLINKGTGAARNSGISAAQGTYIAFLDSDDLWLPNKLEFQLDFMQKYGQAMSFSSYELIGENGERIDKLIEALPELSYPKLLKSNYIGNLTGMYNSREIGKIYSPLLRKRQDWALWLNVLEKTGTVKGILQPLAVYRIRKNSLSKNKGALISYNFRIYRQFLQYGLLKSFKYLTIFLWEHFMVKTKQLKCMVNTSATEPGK